MTTPSLQSASSERPVVRHYTYVEVSVLMVTFAICALMLDSGGLMTWANRLHFGPAQNAWLRALTPVDHALERARLTKPRALLVATSDAWSARWARGADDAPRADPAAPLPTASPAPLAAELDGPLGHLHVASAGDEVELPTLGDGEQPAPPPAGPTDVTILLIGDSMMQIGLAPGIAAAYAQDPHVRVLRETHLGTGLSRPDVFDWPGELSRKLRREHPRFVVASFGGNDAQDMRLGGQLIPFGTSRWDAAYQERVHAFMEELAHDGAQVLWVGLPPMRADDFNERVNKLNDLAVAASRGMRSVQFLDTTPMVTGDDHAFATYLPAPGGGLIQVRLEDGIHLSSAGGERVAAQAVSWISGRALGAAGAALNEVPAAPSRLSVASPGG